MRKYLLYAFLFIQLPGYCQKIILDKTDAFTGVRSVTSNLSNLKTVGLTPILQFVGTLEANKDSATDIKLSFIVPDLGLNVQSNDSSNYECLLKSEDGSIYKGKYFSFINGETGYKSEIVFTYIFSISDAEEILQKNCTDLKFTAPNGHQGKFQIDGNAQSKIPKTLRILFDKVKA